MQHEEEPTFFQLIVSTDKRKTTGPWWTIRADCFFVFFFYCKADWEPWTQQAQFWLWNTRWSCDPAARPPRTRSAWNTEGLIRPPAPERDLLCSVSRRNKRSGKLFVSQRFWLWGPRGRPWCRPTVTWLTVSRLLLPCFWRWANRGENQACLQHHKLQKSKPAINGSYAHVLLL